MTLDRFGVAFRFWTDVAPGDLPHVDWAVKRTLAAELRSIRLDNEVALDVHVESSSRF